MGEFASPEIHIERNTKHVILIPRVLNTFNRMEFTIDENKSPVLEDGSASTSFLDPSVDWALTPVHKILAIQKQTEHGHFKRKFSCHFQDPSNFRQPPQPCKKNSSRALKCPSHIDSFSQGPKPISLVFRHSPSLNLQWPSKTFIHPPRMTMTDLATKRSICICSVFLHFFLFYVCVALFFPSFSSLSFCFPHFILLLFCWCAEYDEKVRVQMALTPWHVKATNQSLFDLGEQLIHMFIHPFDTPNFPFHFSKIHVNINVKYPVIGLSAVWICELHTKLFQTSFSMPDLFSSICLSFIH